MKKIALIKDDSFFWNYIEAYLGSINAAVDTFPHGASDDEIAACGAELLIVGSDHVPPIQSPLGGLRTIVIGEGDWPLPGKTRAWEKKKLLLRWPISKNLFLRETADILGVSPRKSFRSMIRVFTPASNIGFVGRTIDFSFSGMSFSADQHYSIGQEVSISFSIPNEERSLLLRGRIARGWNNEADGSSEYGVEFMSLDPEAAKVLETFIMT